MHLSSTSCRALLEPLPHFANLCGMTFPSVQSFYAMALLVASSAFCAEPLKWETKAGYRAAAVSPAKPGKTGLTLRNSTQTGIGFTNFLSIAAASTNHNLMQGAGVAAGDIDGDGWCDLYFCSIEGRNTLYRNLGNLRFEDVTEKAGVACPGMLSTGAAIADVNGDGAPDLIVAANNGARLFFNQGNGQFTNGTVAAGLITKPLGGMSVALADLDGNGALDLFVANYGEVTILRSGGDVSYRIVNGKPVVSGRFARRWKIVGGKLLEFGEPSSVYLNDGKGRFTPISWTDGRFLDEDGKPLKELPMDLSLSVMLRDINGDGAPDIYVSNDFQTPDRIWINDGKANFRALPRLAMRHSSHFSMGADFADIDRDGRDDFVVMDMLSRFHALKMTQIIDTNLMTSRPGEIDDRPQVRHNTLFWNRGDGTYAEIGNFAGIEASDWTWTPAFIDVDLDGYEDLLVSNGHAFDTQDLDAGMIQGGKGPIEAQKQLMSFPKLETPNYAFRNRRDRTFEEIGAQWGFDSKQVCHGVIFADLDNDADLDVVVSSLNAPPLIYQNESAAPRVLVRLKGKAPNTRGVGARIKVRGGSVPEQSQEIICGGRYLSADEPARMFAAGTPTNRLNIEVTWRNGTRSVVNDALANCIYEIDEAGARPAESPMPKVQSPAPLFKDVSSLLAHKHAEEIFDDFVRQPLLSRKLSQLGPGVAWIDFDADGRHELVIGGGRNGALTVVRSSGAQTFARTEMSGIVSDDLLGMSAWANGNKRSLLVARASYESGGPGALLSLSAAESGWVVSTQSVVLSGSPGPLAVADVDGDGDLDVFVGARVNPGRYPEAAASQIFRNEKGNLVLDTENSRLLQNAGMVSAALWSDLDGDGFPELILACEWGSPRILRNDHGKLSSWNPRITGAALDSRLSTLDRFTGWWTSITTGDIDGDGRLDIIAGNWGLNSWYRATAQQPQKLYYGDFIGDGSISCIESEFDPVLEKFVPRENLTILAPAMPFLRATFPTHASVRRAGLRELLGERFNKAKEVQAATLATTLFLNRGDHFEAVSLPQEAQWAPVFGICVADADGDGSDDVFLAQNFFATRKEVPRLDGGRGLWLHNDRIGNLRPMRADESGVTVWGEQRGCATGDFDDDGRVDLVVSQNGASTRLFRNETGKPGVRVRLKGPSGNPDGIGAVVRLKYADGLGPARSIHGGSGYLSQDSTVPILGARGLSTHVVVRWPGGKVTEAPIITGAKEAVIEIAK
jgi:enediyne biosynthesis protein E4